MSDMAEEPQNDPNAFIEQGMTDDELGGWMLVICQMLSLLGIGFVAYGAWPWPVLTWVLVGLGLAIGAAGFAGLKNALHIHPEPNKAGLRTGGIYGLIRHPMYLALLLIGVGVCSAGEPKGWVAFGLLALILLSKIATEEKALTRVYPEFAEYRARTKRLIPFVW